MIPESVSMNWNFREYRLRPLISMRVKCLDCCGFVYKEVKECQCYACPLWPYRMGSKENIPLKKLKEISKIKKEAHL